MDYKKIYINGEWIDGDSGDFIDVENPADKSIIAQVPRGNADDINKAVIAAKNAFPLWREVDLNKRIKIIKSVIDKMRENIDDMAETVVLELGSGYEFSRDTHIVSYIDEAENYLSIAKDYEYEKVQEHSIIRREPKGVIGCLTPWNFPLEQIVKKVFPALINGNTVVLKPSQITPLTAYKLMKIFDESDIPKGVINMVTGSGREIGNALASHEDVDMMSFTGSTTGGREVGREALGTIKSIVLELGGKSATILIEGGNYESGIQSTLDTTFLNSGQTCNATTRLIAPRKDKKIVENIILEKTKEYKVGNPSDKSVDIGPLSTQKQFDKVKGYVKEGIEEGATVLLGEVPENSDKGYYFAPFVFTDVKNNMVIAQEEIFGPVLCVIYYNDLQEAIDIANDSKYGLGGLVVGPKDKAMEVARKIETGSIYVNDADWDMNAPFGGYKQSGIGREGGREGFEEFLEIKTIYI